MEIRPLRIASACIITFLLLLAVWCPISLCAHGKNVGKATPEWPPGSAL